MRALIRLALALVLCLTGGATALAHTLSESHSAWQVQGNTVHLQFTVPDLEAKRLSKSGHDMPPSAQLGKYLADRVSVLADKKKCDMATGPTALAATNGYSRFEFDFKCPTDKGITIRSDAFYDLVPSHTDFAQIENSKGQFFEQLLVNDHRSVDVSTATGGSELDNAGFLKFIQMGIWHIFTGIDHMSFMLGLVLISRRVRDLLFVVTGFTIGHSITLALAVTGIVRPEPQFIDALVAFTIAMIGAENIGDSTHKPAAVAIGMGGLLLLMAGAKYVGIEGLTVTLPILLLIGGGIFGSSYLMMTGHMRDAGRVRLIMTLVFGTIHGFGFASNLLEMRLPTNKIAELLIGFNSGVEIGQITVVLSALLVAYVLSKVRLAIPRPLFTDIAAAYLVGEGLYWFLTRSMVLG
jgi:hypothetical protein